MKCPFAAPLIKATAACPDAALGEDMTGFKLERRAGRRR